MKKSLLFSILFALSMTLFSQTKTWIGSSGGSFNVAANWNPVGVPGSNNDVIIPTGSNLIMDGATIKSFDIQGNAEVTMTNTVYFTDTSSIAANASFTWSTGYLQGTGTLNNNGSFTVINTINRYIQGPATTINNSGTLNFPIGFFLFVADGSIINNLSTGVIDFQTEAYIVSDGILNNEGLIKKSGGTGTSSISLGLNNTGTIDVQSGTLNLDTGEDKILDGGIYNVATGSVLWLSGNSIHLSGTLTGQLDGELKCGSYGNNITVANAATLDFTGNGFNWDNGHLNGDGVLTNNGIFNFSSTANRYIDGATTLVNQGTINFTVGCTLFVNGDSVIDNTSSGVIDFQIGAAIGSGENGVINNEGLIEKTDGTTSYISAKMINTGTISVETETLDLGSGDKTLDGGVYNVVTGSVLKVTPGNINLSGSLTGQVDGEMKFGSYGGNVTVANTATLDFAGNGIHWSDGHLIGDGILTNNGIFNFSSTANKYIEGTTTLENQGNINFTVGCTLFVSNDSVIDNKASGVIDFQIEASIGSNENGFINNEGLIKKTNGTGVTYINLNTNNSGIIDVMSGELEFMNGKDFTNMTGGKVMGAATIDVPAAANFINNGIFAPGDSPGTLTVIGDFNSSSTSQLEIELNGNNQGLDYDLLAVQGNAIMDGTVNVTMGYAANLNDEFIVATTSGTISQCNLAPTTSADFDGMTYTFDVFCRNDNQVVLGVNNIALGIDDHNLSDSRILMYPNPTRNQVTLKNNGNIPLVSATIMDISGRILSVVDLKGMNGSKDISLETYASGNYFIKIDALNSSIVKQIVKQ